MRKYIKLLQNIGFQEKDSIIYLSLLDNGTSSIANIVDNTNLHRIEVYRLLPKLIDEGFVLVSLKGKRKYYSPVNPSKIEEIYLENLERNKHSISELQQKFVSINKKPKVTYLNGNSGITHVFSDIVNSLDKGQTYYRITSETDTESIDKLLPKNYRELRDKKDLERFVIMSEKSAKLKKSRLERDLVVIPERIDEFRDNIFMTIYGSKVAYIDFTTKASIIIENKQIAKFQEKAFKLLFNSLRK